MLFHRALETRAVSDSASEQSQKQKRKPKTARWFSAGGGLQSPRMSEVT
jgi:hypothetical protein